MGNIFQRDTQLENGKVYVMNRSIQYYNFFDDEEPESQQSNDILYCQILKDVKDDKYDGKPRVPTFRRFIKQIKEYSIPYQLINSFLCILYYIYK